MADLQMQQNEITVVPPPPPFSPTTSSIGYIDFEESDDEEYTEYGYDDMKYAVNTTCSPTKKEKQKKRSPRKQGSKRSPESQGLIRRSDSRFSSRSLKMNFSPNKRKKSGGSVGSTSSHKIEIPDACNNTENKPDKVSRRMSIKQNLHSFAQRVRRSSQWNMGFGTKGDPETGVPPQKPSTKERFYQIAIAMCYLLIAIIAIVVTYSMIANLVHSLQHPVRSIKYNKVKEHEAPGIAIYPGGARFPACNHYFQNVVTSKVRLNQLDLKHKTCKYVNLTYSDPHYPNVTRNALVIRGPSKYSVIRHWDKRNMNVRNKTHLFFIFFEWKNNIVEQSFLLYTTSPWSIGAGLCGVFLTLHKAYTLLQASVKKLKKEKKKTKLAQRARNTTVIKCNCPCQQQSAQVNEMHIQDVSQSRV